MPGCHNLGEIMQTMPSGPSPNAVATRAGATAGARLAVAGTNAAIGAGGKRAPIPRRPTGASAGSCHLMASRNPQPPFPGRRGRSQEGKGAAFSVA